MMKGLIKKTGIVLGMFLVTAGVAFAAFTLTYNVSSGNTVKAASAALKVTSSVINTEGLTAGSSTAPVALKIENIGSYTGTVKLNVTGTTGSLCNDLTLAIGGDLEKSFNPIANGSVVLGELEPGEVFNLTQSVSMKAGSAQFGQTCMWNTTATFTDQ